MVTIAFEEVAKLAEQRPGLPRSGACAHTLPPWHDQDVIMFGGYVEAEGKARAPTNEAWTFSSTAGAWSRVTYAPGGAVPRPRLVTQAVVVGERLWVLGGWDSSVEGPDAFLSDVWTLHLRSWSWQQVQLQGEALPRISRFQAVALGALIYIHTHKNLQDVFVLDTAAQPPRLSTVPVSGPAPAPRGLHSMVPLGPNSLLLFGGAPQNGPMMDDVWRLHLGPPRWEKLQPAGTPPHARCSAAAAPIAPGAALFVGGAYYGAAGGLEMLGDAAVVEVAAGGGQAAWVVPVVKGDRPRPRNAAVMVPLPVRAPEAPTRLLLHGGWRAFVETYADTFIVTVDGGWGSRRVA